MTVVIDLIIITLAVLWWRKRRINARAITKAADRNVWAQASDARFPRTPRSRNPFSRKDGLR